MGMDFVAIIENKYSTREMLNIPSIIDKHEIIKSLYKEKHKDEIQNNPNHINKKAVWDSEGDRIMNEFNLKRIWNHLREDTSVESQDGLCHDTMINTFFGWLYIYEKSISIKLFPEHKYGNLRNPISSNYVFEFIRELAKLFNADKIVYCCDSYYIPSIIEEKFMMGGSISEVIEFGNNIFGIPPKELNAAIANLYFIDEFDLNLSDLDPEKEVWSRAKFEYEKEEKGEPPYNNV